MSISDNPLAALGPIAWDTIDHHALGHFLADTFTCAQILADSIPTTAASSSTGGRPRSQTDGAVSYGVHSAPASHHGSGTATPSSLEDMSAKAEKLRQDLRQSWKEVKTGGSNPRDIVVYKMNGGREGYAGSSWFARRSVHRVEKAKPASNAKDKNALSDRPDVAIEFDMFRRALLKEFSLPEQVDEAKGKTGGASSTVRTMTTKKRVEHVVVDGQGHDAKEEETATKSDEPNPTTRQLDVYQLEAEFPGPTATRDFVTMLLTTQSPCYPSSSTSSFHQHGLRQFMLVSKPCDHPETPQRSGYVRAQYESVEVIREIRVPVAVSARGLAAGNTRRTRSSIDLVHGGGGDTTDTDISDRDTDGHETAIEWLMITRNNPGGSVPRFLVDKSTPSSIISDANKFLDWMVAQQVEAAQKEDAYKGQGQAQGVVAGKPVARTPLATAIPEENEGETGQKDALVNETSDTEFAADDTHNNARSSSSPSVTILSMESSGGAASSAKLFNMLSGALGGAGTVVASKLPNPFGGAVQALHSSFEGHPGLDDDDDNVGIDTSDDDSGGDTYSDIDDGDAVVDEKSRGRSRRSTQDETTAGDIATDKSTADTASVSSLPPPPPTTALEMLAHDRALALRRLNDPSSTGLSTGASSVAASDVENDTETGSGTTRQKKADQQAAAKAAKSAKAAEAARKKHEKELLKLQDRQRKAEADILKANKGKVKGVEVVKGVGAVKDEEKDKEKEEVGNSSQSTMTAKSTKSVAESASGAPAAADSSSSSLSADPALTELQKLREKHDRAVARQEAQYKREMEKLERKRQQQAEKEAARLRKQQERDAKADTALQLTHARAERDVARKEFEVLTERVRQLVAQNELLAAEVAQSTGKAKLNAKVEDAEEA